MENIGWRGDCFFLQQKQVDFLSLMFFLISAHHLHMETFTRIRRALNKDVHYQEGSPELFQKLLTTIL